MIRYLYFAIALLITSCQTKMSFTPKDILFNSEAFTVHKDRVVQGVYSTIAVSRDHIISNYVSPASENYPRQISFKFSINEKDNELPYGIDHHIIIRDEHESPLIKFGQMPSPMAEVSEAYLSPNYEYTFKVDLSPVFSQFNEKGYYEGGNGSRIAFSDFKGVFIAGGSEPLSWDFVNLRNKGLKLEDTGTDNIYSITLNLNPYQVKENDTKQWQKSINTSDKPVYTSDQPIVDALYNLSLEEAKKNIEPDSTLRTGAKWAGVWTRDISYSIFLAFAYHEPEIARVSLLKKVKRDRIVQDTGSGGAWPISSDRTVWSIAAWEIYKVTGDMEWLKQAYTIIKNTLEDDAKTLQSESGLYKGESSFLDWREQTYPKWMANADIFVSENLGTNVIHFQAHRILAAMATTLGLSDKIYKNEADVLKNAINSKLWLPEKGYYSQYRYGRGELIRSNRFEALGEALAILFDVADVEQSKEIIKKSPVTKYGIPCIYPQIPDIPPYHNNAVWPFVQAYWNLAAAKTGNENALTHGLASIYRAGGLFLTNYENFVAQSGDFNGTEINSDRMLWSIAGNIAMVHRVFIGMNFGINGIRFSPVIPQSFGGVKTLNGFKYRKAILNIKVTGFGKNVSEFIINGKKMQNAYFDASETGIQNIEIIMDNVSFDQQEYSHVNNHFSARNPVTKIENNVLSWQPIEGVISYFIFKNGIRVQATQNTYLITNPEETAEYSVSAVDSFGFESFISEPILISTPGNIHIFQVENFTDHAETRYSNYSGSGYIEISTDKNQNLSFDADIMKEGTYQIDFRYSNGSGPWNTDNKCAIRSLYCNGSYISSLVFPQRGTNEWSEWGMSNSVKVKLVKGQNHFILKLEPWNNNMNVEINKAMLDYVRIIRLSE